MNRGKETRLISMLKNVERLLHWPSNIVTPLTSCHDIQSECPTKRAPLAMGEGRGEGEGEGEGRGEEGHRKSSNRCNASLSCRGNVIPIQPAAGWIGQQSLDHRGLQWQHKENG